MLKLYIANKNYSSWSLRPWVLLHELYIQFEEILTEFQGDGYASGFDRFSPTAKVPCLTDGETVVWDSLAIVEYLAERHSGVWPSDVGARTWARCAAAEMHAGFSSLRERCTMNCGLRIRLDNIPTPLQHDIARLDALWQQGLMAFGGPFLAGSSFTAVDAFYAPIAFRIQTYNLELSAKSLAYADHLLALPSMQAWYQAALAETARDSAHEAEARRAGEWLKDARA